MAERSYLPVDVVERFMTDVFIALGVPDEDARVSTDVLISSDLRGIESHGVGRLKYYYDRIVSGRHLPTTEFEIVKETETTALVDGHHGMGHPIANRAMRMAMDKAKRYGTGAVAVRNGTHFGIAGYYPLMAAAEGMVGFCFTNARPSIPPTFGTEPMMGTNPIAFAAPSDRGFPFCFDGATAIIQRGKVECAAREEKPLPEGTIVDPRGECLMDPDVILREMVKGNAAALAIGGAGEERGGHKGYGLAAMVEVLSASFCNGAFLKDLSGFGEDGSPAHFRLGHFFMAIDVEHFLPLEEFERTTGAIMRALQCSRKAPGQDRIYVAGERERDNELRIRQEGVPANPNLLKDLATVRDELGIKGYKEYF